MSPTSTDLVRALAVLVTAITQVVSSPLTTLALGPSSNTGAISDANRSPITPAGYAFAIWGLIYLACLALAVYQLLPSQRGRAVHRRCGWWLVGAFTASSIWVPIFGTRTLWLAQVVIVVLVALLLLAVRSMVHVGPARDDAERWLLRLPVTVYLGWATLAAAAGMGTTLRSLGMGEQGRAVTAVGLGLIAVAAAVSVAIIGRLTALAGFVFTAAWALVAVAVGTDNGLVRVAALAALVFVLGALAARASRSQDRAGVLLG